MARRRGQSAYLNMRRHRLTLSSRSARSRFFMLSAALVARSPRRSASLASSISDEPTCSVTTLGCGFALGLG